MITLGQKVKDKISGFTGIATARIEYLNGCVQYCVSPKTDKDGKRPDAEWFDDAILEVVSGGINIPREPDGGPIPDMPSDSYGG
jgi:hypothetical protein